MGQLYDTMSPTNPRVIFDEKGDNGLVICDNYVPAELLTEIFYHADHKTLLNCQLVCKRWKILLQNYVWRKKAEMILGKPFPRYNKIPWDVYYLVCKKRAFERNLLKNHSGEQGKDHWEILSEGGNCWTVENPPVGVPELPLTESVFEGKQFCFTTSYHSCTKVQLIDLVTEGFHPYVLDVLQPPIMVSEWYSCRWDSPGLYECNIKLLKVEGAVTELLDEFKFRDIIEGDKQNQWLHVSHVFENYGQGLRKIRFYHGGMDRSFWAGHYGAKMAGAYVCIKIPSITMHTYDDESDTPPILDE